MKKYITKKSIIAYALSRMALGFSVIGANSKCFYIYHQPITPKEINKLRKF